MQERGTRDGVQQGASFVYEMHFTGFRLVAMSLCHVVSFVYALH